MAEKFLDMARDELFALMTATLGVHRQNARDPSTPDGKCTLTLNLTSETDLAGSASDKTQWTTGHGEN